jgi:ABC-type uncharacterized transport system fused permease/ATPase subunit
LTLVPSLFLFFLDAGWASASWLYVTLAVTVLRSVSPNFGKLLSIQQAFESKFRAGYGHVTSHAESIAAYNGEEREKELCEENYSALRRHIKKFIGTRYWFSIMEDVSGPYLICFSATVDRSLKPPPPVD